MKSIGLKTLLYISVVMFSVNSWAHSHDGHKHSEESKTKQVKSAQGLEEAQKEVKGDTDIIVTVNGMVCSFCSTNIENKLKKNKEVKMVKVDLDQKKVFITLKEGQTLADDKIKNEIKKAGYKVVSIKRG